MADVPTKKPNRLRKLFRRSRHSDGTTLQPSQPLPSDGCRSGEGNVSTSYEKAINLTSSLQPTASLPPQDLRKAELPSTSQPNLKVSQEVASSLLLLDIRNRSPSPQETQPNHELSQGAHASVLPTIIRSADPAATSQPVQVARRDLWSEALQILSSKEKDFITKLNPETTASISMALQVVLNDVKDQKAICETNRWKVTIWGRTWILHELAANICGLLDKLKQVGDIVVNVDPLHAGLPWALIRPLIQVVVSGSQQMAALLLGLQRVTWLISRCQIYESLYLHELQPCDSVTNLESALIELYAAILQFLAKARGLYADKALSRAGHAFLRPDDVGEFHRKCEVQADQVQTAANDCALIYDRKSRVQETAMAEKLQKILYDLKDDLFARLDTKISALWDRSNEEKREKILRWISNIPVKDNHWLASEGRTSGTGEWLLRNETYQFWRSSNKSMILWLHGIPGAGKTKLVSRVIDDLSNISQLDASDEALAYFYCDRNETPRQVPGNVLLSFIKQLSISPGHDAIHYLLVQAYDKKEKEGFVSNKFSVSESTSLLHELIGTFPKTTLVIDALDECDPRLRRDFIKTLNYLVENLADLKILISSRRDHDLQLQLEEKANVGISATDNEMDIARYLTQVFKEDDRSGFIHLKLQEEIVHTLLRRSEGMFQWAVLQIDQLLELGRVEDVKEYLGRLPSDLEAAYNQLFLAIQSQKGSRPEIAARAFQWIMSSAIPLSPERLIAAVCQDPETDAVNEVTINIDFVLDACRNLLVVDRVQHKCRFAHLSIQEYFEKNHWTPQQSNLLVTKTCLLMLHLPDPWAQDPLESCDLKGRPTKTVASHTFNQMNLGKSDRAYNLSTLLSYSRFYWLYHVQECERGEIDDRVTELLQRFLGSMNESGPAYRSWFDQSPRVYNQTFFPWDLTKHLEPSTSASFAVSFFGFDRILSEWWGTGFADVDRQNQNGDSLLMLAIQGGGSHYTVKRLLELGANVNVVGGEHGSALLSAVDSGDIEVIQLLLSFGADVNARAEYKPHHGMKTADIAGIPVLEPRSPVLEQQLRSDYHYDKSPVMESNLTSSDSNCGKRPSFELSPSSESAVVVQARSKLYSPLKLATMMEAEHTVRLLLSSGADPNSSALKFSIKYGFHNILQLLLSHGADPNTKGRKGISFFTLAMNRGNEAVVKLLLENGADVNAIGGNHGSAFITAVLWGNESIVQRFLELGANVNLIVGGKYGSALGAAASRVWQTENRRMRILGLLIEAGADLNADIGGDYGSTLVAAVRHGREDAVQLLLDKGADINLEVGGRYGSALSAAVRIATKWVEQTSMVRLLLERNAKVTVREMAAAQGNEAITLLLRQYGGVDYSQEDRDALLPSSDEESLLTESD